MSSPNGADRAKYSSLGAFSPSEAKRLLDRLRIGHLNFRVAADPSPGTSNYNGAGQSRSFAYVDVSESDLPKAHAIMKELGLELVVTEDEIARASREPLPGQNRP
jgi:hypothetical protein